MLGANISLSQHGGRHSDLVLSWIFVVVNLNLTGDQRYLLLGLFAWHMPARLMLMIRSFNFLSVCCARIVVFVHVGQLDGAYIVHVLYRRDLGSFCRCW